PAPRAAGAQGLPASRPTEMVLVAETVVGTHASNATRPPHTRMLRATRTTRSGRTRISVSSGRPPIRRPAARSEGTIGRARALAITCSGEPPLVAVRLPPRAPPYYVPPPCPPVSIFTRLLVHEPARHQDTVAVQRPMRHRPGK